MKEVCVRASALRGWQSRLRQFGNAPECLASFSSFPNCRTQAETPLSLRTFVGFSEKVVRETRDATIPWLIGTHYDIPSLGPVGNAVRQATTVGSALRRLVDCFGLLQDCTDIRLECDERFASLSYRILDPEIWPRHQDAMFSLGIMAQLIRAGRQDGWDQVEFFFEASHSELGGDMCRVVDAPCSFAGDTNMLRFPARLLDLRLHPQAAGGSANDISRMIVEKNRATPLAERLAHVVYRDLDRLGIDQERIAREVGMSSRTMRRRLASEGSSFQQVLDECRMRQAVFEFRTKPNLAIAQIALRLGYAEHSTFTRAFHRWSGVSPQDYCERLVSRMN